MRAGELEVVVAAGVAIVPDCWNEASVGEGGNGNSGERGFLTVGGKGVHAAFQGLGVGAGAEGANVGFGFGGDESGRGGDEGDGGEVHLYGCLLVSCDVVGDWSVLGADLVLVLVAAVLLFDTSSTTRNIPSLYPSSTPLTPHPFVSCKSSLQEIEIS